MMLHIAFTICRIAAPQDCDERLHSFVPRQPVACIFAAGPELERLIPDGWTVVRLRCTAAPRPKGR